MRRAGARLCMGDLGLPFVGCFLSRSARCREKQGLSIPPERCKLAVGGL